jgi:polyhydroxyalkanoate synthase
VTAGASWFDRIDEARREAGAALERFGFGPLQSPHDCVSEVAGARLLRYHDLQGARDDGAHLLIVPAPIKRHYIWDLAPSYSVVQQALRRGFRVYLAQWTESPPDWGLDNAVESIERCIGEVAREAGKSPHLLGHSLGGTLCALAAARYPAAAASLVLVEAPLRLADAAGDFARLLRCTPSGSSLASAFACVPGSVLDLAAVLGCPQEFAWERELDGWLALLDPKALDCHWRAVRWTLDELPLPGRLFAQVVDDLYRGDGLMLGRLQVHGRPVKPEDVRAPILVVVDPRSRVVPPASIVPFVDAASSPSKRVLHYHGDVGVALQHLGPLIGASAHRSLWPEILDSLANVERSR